MIEVRMIHELFFSRIIKSKKMFVKKCFKKKLWEDLHNAIKAIFCNQTKLITKIKPSGIALIT